MIENWSTILERLAKDALDKNISGTRYVEDSGDGVPIEYKISNSGKRIEYSNGERVIIDWNEKDGKWERFASDYGEISWYAEGFDRPARRILHNHFLELRNLVND